MSASDAGVGPHAVRTPGGSRLPLALLVVVGAVHARAWFGGFVYDDRLLVSQNAALQHGDLADLLTRPLFNGVADYWRPLAMLGLWLGNAVGGAAGIHVLAWLAHLVATWFAWRIARRVVANAAPAFAAALLFGLHPVQVEGVAWCSSFNDPLWWAFGLWSVDAALRSAHAVTAAAFVLAMLAKENAVVVLPIALAARWWQRQPLRPALLALVGAGLLWWLLRGWMFGSLTGGIGHGVEDPVVRERWPLAALESFGRQLELLVWPWPMSPFRTLTGKTAELLRASVWALAWLVAFAAALWRGARWLAFALVLVAAPPLLAAVFCHRLGGYPIADRYLGPAVLGAALLLVGRRPGHARLGVASALAVIAAAASVVQAGIWRGPQQLAARGLEVAPADPMVLVMTGNLLLEQGDVLGARDTYRAALAPGRVYASGAEPRVTADAQIGLAWCLLRASPPDPRQAAAAFEQVLRDDGGSAFAWVGLGVAHGMAGRAADAERALRRAIELDPGNSQAHFNLAYLFAQSGRRAEARVAAAAALRCDPANRQAEQLLHQLR